MLEFDSKETEEMYNKVPLELKIKALHLEEIYGYSYIILNKDGSYSVYYYNWDKKEVIEVKD